MRYFLKLSYDGSAFHGWQSQPNAVSIQSTIEGALSLLLQKDIKITGAGRTDTGVHAKEMYAHFDINDKIIDNNKFLLSLNSLIGDNIAIQDILTVSNEAHARFDATERTYKYLIAFEKNPFQKKLFWKSPSFLDIEIMNEASSILLKTEDFTSFAKLHSDTKTNICDVRNAEWKRIEDDPETLDFIGRLNNGLVFTISADRFLRNMVRAIVGTIVDVGRGKMNIRRFKEVIEKKDRGAAGISMPANGLFLWKISYPFLN